MVKTKRTKERFRLKRNQQKTSLVNGKWDSYSGKHIDFASAGFFITHIKGHYFSNSNLYEE